VVSSYQGVFAHSITSESLCFTFKLEPGQAVITCPRHGDRCRLPSGVLLDGDVSCNGVLPCKLQWQPPRNHLGPIHLRATYSWYGKKYHVTIIITKLDHFTQQVRTGGLRGLFRHYATSRKIAGSIRFFNWPNPSSRTMTLRSTQTLTEMSTRNLLGGKRRPEQKADNLTAICEPNVFKMWEPRSLTTLWASTACYRDSITVFYRTSWCRDNSYSESYRFESWLGHRLFWFSFCG
jgi:hypothetical protein